MDKKAGEESDLKIFDLENKLQLLQMENENLKENMVKDREQLTKAQNDIKKKVN